MTPNVSIPSLVCFALLTLFARPGAALQSDAEDTLARYHDLIQYAWAPLDATRLAEARAAARELLEEGRDPDSPLDRGDTLHHGFLIRGRVALYSNDLDGARRALREAGRVPSSLALDTFGPNMTLARELLARGEAGVVIEYLRTCAGLWNPAHAKLDAWIDVIAHGGTPEFGPNLSY